MYMSLILLGGIFGAKNWLQSLEMKAETRRWPLVEAEIRALERDASSGCNGPFIKVFHYWVSTFSGISKKGGV